MDNNLQKLRSFISDSGVDVWTLIDSAIAVASADHEGELRSRRDGIVQKLYASACVNCVRRNGNAATHDEDDGEEQKEILEIRNLLDDHAQNEKWLIDLLQRLVDMNTSFTALKETKIGRHVTKLRKHSSNEVRRLVKILVRKWKETVDEWVRQNTNVEEEEEADFNVAKDGNIENGVKAVYSHPTPTKKKAKDDGTELSDQESPHAKKQRRPQVMDISKLNTRNSIVPNNGGTVPVKYW